MKELLFKLCDSVIQKIICKMVSKSINQFARPDNAYFRCRAQTRHAENISARLGSGWHATVLDEENIAVLKQLY